MRLHPPSRPSGHLWSHLPTFSQRNGTGSFRKIFLVILGIPIFIAVACGGGKNGDSGGLDRTQKLSSGDFAFEVALVNAQRATGEVRRAGEIATAPSGTDWWSFEIEVKNVSDQSMASANTPDVGIACGDETATDAETFDNPGFIMGSPPYASGMLNNGASNTGLVPLAVPSDATDCRLVIRMDPLHDPAPPEVVEFPFQTTP